MENQDLYELFVSELEDMYSAENQIIASLPKMIDLASLPDLKETLSTHLKETRQQVVRLDKIFSILQITPQQNTCEAMRGLIKEADEIVANRTASPTLDAAIICAVQKIEHYEIASYGTMRSFATHLEFDSDVADLLQDSLDEEGEADKKLTKIADGFLFFGGVNKDAAEEVVSHGRNVKS